MNQTNEYISAYGWDHYLSIRNGEGCGVDDPARIVTRYNRNYLIACRHGLVQAEWYGRSAGASAAPEDELLPAVGDWVLTSAEPGQHGGGLLIREILSRYGVLSRKAAGREKETKEQVIAANIDLCLIVTSLDGEFSAPRIERFLTISREAGIDAAVLLNKADTARPEHIARFFSEAEEAASGFPVFLVSARTGLGMERIEEILPRGKTAVLAGSSGVGKSSIINYMSGETRQDTGEVRQADSKGRHTTVRRELFVLPSGSLIIDSPGIRELQLWAGENSLLEVFADIDEISGNCRFSDCSHNTEPGCAVQAALRTGLLSEARYLNFVKMRSELKFLETRKDDLARRMEKAKWKAFSKQVKGYYRFKRGS